MELLFKSKPKPITPLDSCVYTLNNRTPSYISELKIPMSQMWHNQTAIVCMQTVNPDETAQARLSVQYSHMQ